jgi:hypothetical protein
MKTIHKIRNIKPKISTSILKNKKYKTRKPRRKYPKKTHENRNCKTPKNKY